MQTNYNYKKTEILKPSKVYFIKKNKLKIAYKIIYVQKQSFRAVLHGRSSPDMKQTHRRTKSQKRDINKAAFSALLKSHSHTYTPPKIRSTSAEHPPPGGLLLHVKIF